LAPALLTPSPAPRFPVSVKGVVFLESGVVLLRNERDEWELPGGKLERGEDPAACLVREVGEELSIGVSAERILDCWRYDIAGRAEVVIVTYGCRALETKAPRASAEHKAVGTFPVADIEGLNMPEGYRRSIRNWHRLAGEG
jgi:8-oxo-dGTP pyrophosphatase MutT (NUDIX family)